MTDALPVEGTVFAMKGHEIVLFHSALGLRPGVLRFAGQLRDAGHTVYAPDLYDGEVFEDATGAIGKIQEIGFDGVLARSEAAVSQLPNELVYAGFSNGGACAELLAASRRGARAAVLIGAPLLILDLGWKVWPAAVPVQVHFGEEDPLRNPRVIDSFAERVRHSGATFQERRYPGAGHHFADPDLPAYNAAASALLLDQVLDFLSLLPHRATTSE